MQKKYAKSAIAMLLCCIAFKWRISDPLQMAIFKGMHEHLRSWHRDNMIREGKHLLYAEMPIDSANINGYSDDVFVAPDGTKYADEIVCNSIPPLYKMIDSAIVVGYLWFVKGIRAVARVVGRSGIVTVPLDFANYYWLKANSDDFKRQLALSDDEKLQFLNPGSGVCKNCDNEKCPYCPNRIAN